MTSIQAKPVDTYISEQHYEDCEYFLGGYIPFNGCESEKEVIVEDKFDWWHHSHHKAVVANYLLPSTIVTAAFQLLNNKEEQWENLDYT